MVIVEFNFSNYQYNNNDEPYTVSAIIKDMYNIMDPSKKYFKLGSQKNKYRLGELKENILVFTSLDKFKVYYNIPDEINLHVSGLRIKHNFMKNFIIMIISKKVYINHIIKMVT